jgi:hypothetical protein
LGDAAAVKVDAPRKPFYRLKQEYQTCFADISFTLNGTPNLHGSE